MNLGRKKKLKIKRNSYGSAYALYEGRELTLNDFKSGTLPMKATKDEGPPSELATQLQILTPKKRPQRLPITLAKLKAGNTSENLLNETRQII